MANISIAKQVGSKAWAVVVDGTVVEGGYKTKADANAAADVLRQADAPEPDGPAADEPAAPEGQPSVDEPAADVAPTTSTIAIGADGLPVLPKAKRTRKPKAPKACSCGCGGETRGGRFIPGHDAKLAGWVLRVERKTIALSDIPHDGIRSAVAGVLSIGK